MNSLSRFPSTMERIDLALARAQQERRNLQWAFDADLYGAAGNRFEGYHTSIPASGDDEDDLSAAAGPTMAPRLGLASYTGYNAALPSDNHEDQATATSSTKSRRIIDRENEYRRRRLYRCISPPRHDAFAAGEATPDPAVQTYADAMRENMLQHREEEVLREIAKIKEERKQPVKRRDRWEDDDAAAGAKNGSLAWDDDDDAPDAQRSRWDDDETPKKKQRSRWDDDETPKKKQMLGCDDETPEILRWDSETPRRQRSRWADETPEASMETPLGAEYYIGTPTPTSSELAACGPPSPELYLPWERDIEERNRPLTDDDLDAMFPQKGYKILEPPASYQPMRTPARRLLATTPTPLCTPLYALPPGGVQLRILKQME